MGGNTYFLGFAGLGAGFAVVAPALGFAEDAVAFLASLAGCCAGFFAVAPARGSVFCCCDSSFSNSSLVRPKSLGCSIPRVGCLIAAIEGATEGLVPAGFCATLGAAGFAAAVGVEPAGLVPGWAGLAAGDTGLAAVAPAGVAGLTPVAPAGAAGLAVGGAPAGRCAGCAVLADAESGTSGGTGA